MELSEFESEKKETWYVLDEPLPSLYFDLIMQ